MHIVLFLNIVIVYIEKQNIFLDSHCFIKIQITLLKTINTNSLIQTISNIYHIFL